MRSLKKAILLVCILLLTVYASEITDFYSTQNKCDYLVITPRIFAEGAKTLTEYRNQNTEDDVIEAHYAIYENIVDIKNSFRPDSLLRNALQWALKNWQIKPGYVVFLGDDSAICPAGDSIFISRGPMPSHIDGRIYTNPFIDAAPKETTLTYIESWYATDSREHPQFAIGRIPCENSDQLQKYIEKIKTYERRTVGTWMNKAVFFSDDNWEPDSLYDPVFHEGLIINFTDHLPDVFLKNIYLNDFSDNDKNTLSPRDSFFSAVNQNVNWVILSAHGAPTFVTSEKVIAAKDQSLFKNSESPVILFAMACVNGAFYKKTDSSMCKSFLFSSTGGAVAYIATPNASFSSATNSIIYQISAAENSKPQQSIGKLLMQAQIQTASYITNHFEVFGDPALTRKKTKPLSCTVSFTSNNTIHCTVNTPEFKRGLIAWRVTQDTIDYSNSSMPLLRPIILYEKEQIIERSSFDIKFPDSLPGKRVRFSCFIWNDSMTGSTGSWYNPTSNGVLPEKLLKNTSFARISMVKNRGILFSFNTILSKPSEAEIYSLRGQLLQKVTIPPGCKSYLYTPENHNISTSGISVIRLRSGTQTITKRAGIL